MNKMHGPSKYFASDKNIFEALNQHKIDAETIQKLFEKRNIIVSRSTRREKLAEYFSRLTHDYNDHKQIASRLGVVTRRERTTSMDIKGEVNANEIPDAISSLKEELQKDGDIVQITKNGDGYTVNVQYTDIDYGRSEFNQVQVKDGQIQLIPTSSGYVVRNTQNDYMDNIRDNLISKIDEPRDKKLIRESISLFDLVDPKTRSLFFYNLMTFLTGYNRTNVTDVYVYKARPEEDDSEDEGDSKKKTIDDSHIERVMLKGSGVVTQSELFNQLRDKDYYIVKIGWRMQELKGDGNAYAIEALFNNPKDCVGFSFLIKSVFPFEDGVLSSRKRIPNSFEVEKISKDIEEKAKELLETFHQELTSKTEV
jgi:hypothetical protein